MGEYCGNANRHMTFLGNKMGSLENDERQHNSGENESFDDAVESRVNAMVKDLEILGDATRDLSCLYFTHPSVNFVKMEDGRIIKQHLPGTRTGAEALTLLQSALLGDTAAAAEFGRMVAFEARHYLQNQAADELEREASDRGDV